MSEFPPEYPTYPSHPAAAFGPPPGGYPGQPAYPAQPFGPAGPGFGAPDPVYAPPLGSAGPFAPVGPFGPVGPQDDAPLPPQDAPGTQGSQAPSARRTVLVAAAVAALVGGGVGAGTVALVNNDDSARPVSAALQTTGQTAPAVKIDGSVSAAAAKIRPSVVTIDVTSSREADTGSGVIIRADGYILTNNHVIAGASGSATITVTLADGRRVAATVVGKDPSDDLAVVKVSLTGLVPATFASSASLVVGQTVVAVGAPLGLSDTVTAGIVSSTARPVQTGDGRSSNAVFNAVQTDAAINPGNSGGPLVDLNGSVVGINAAIATDQSGGGLLVPGQPTQAGNIGIGFAIPSDEASRIAGELITTGKATHAVIGVTVRDTPRGQSATAAVGASVQTVKAGGPAAKAGLAPGDLVTQVDAQRIDGADALVAAIRSHAPGQKASITYLRGGASHTVQVTLDSSTE